MKFLNWLDDNFEKYMSSILFMCFTAIMILNVIMRFVFQNALAWASEAVLTIFIWFVFLTVSYAFKQRAHIKVTVITGLLPKKAQKILAIFVELVILVFFIILIKAGVDLLNHFSVKGKTSLLLKYPMWLFYSSAIVGLGLSVLRIVQNGVKDLKKIKELE